MTTHLPTIFLAIAIVASVSSGCRGTEKVTAEQPVATSPADREKALQHYLEGSIYDQKGEYAKAILEYQDALRYDQDPAIYYALSKDYSLIGKHGLAAEMGREAVKRDPQNRTYRENLGKVFFNAFEIDSAIVQYEEVVRIDPYYVEGWYNLARFYHMRLPLKALETYQTMIERFGPSWDVYHQMALLYKSLGRPEEAAKVFGEMLQLDPSNYELKKALGDAHLRSGKLREALDIYDELIERNPDDLESLAALAHIHLLHGDYNLAAEKIQSVLQSDSLTVETQLRFGEFFASFLQKDSSAAPFAFEIFQNIAEKFPDDWRAYWFLGIIANVMENDSAAIANLERVTVLAPTNPDGWVYLSSFYFDKNDFQKAAMVLTEASNFIPEEFRVIFLLGIAYQRMREHEEAASILERALRLNPRDINALSSLALAYDELKRHAEADSLYEQALTVDPRNHIVLNNYAYSLAERDLDLERALTMAKEAVQQQPENASYLDTIGWVYFKLGEYVEAEKFIRKAVDRGDASPVVLEHLGDVYCKLGQKEKALEFWEKSLERDAANDELKKKIQRGSL